MNDKGMIELLNLAFLFLIRFDEVKFWSEFETIERINASQSSRKRKVYKRNHLDRHTKKNQKNFE